MSPKLCVLCTRVRTELESEVQSSPRNEISMDNLGHCARTCTKLCRIVHLGITQMVPGKAQHRLKYLDFWYMNAATHGLQVDGIDDPNDAPIFRLNFTANGQGQEWPWSLFRATTPLPPRTDSSESLSELKLLYEHCSCSHKVCCVGTSDLHAQIRVLKLHSEEVRLVENFDVSQKFAALSYCWGNTIHIETTRSTLPQHMQGISLDELPRTFRDAVSVCKSLGLEYLWIDSLCIIQDDADDWAIEATKMKDVYLGANIVLAAASAKNSSEGFFVTRKKSLQLDGLISISVQLGTDHSYYDSLGDTSSVTEPLMTRGWCFQEALLARRLVYFSSTELIWSCHQQIQCECRVLNETSSSEDLGQQTQTTALRFSRFWTVGTTNHYPDQRIYQYIQQWQLLVENYTSRNLSYYKDRLVAISGVAQHLLDAIAIGSYRFGLFDADLVRQLLWYRPRRTQPKPRPKNLVAPTWSWGSIDELVGWRSIWPNSSVSMDECHLTSDAQIEILEHFVRDKACEDGPMLRLETQVLEGTIETQPHIIEGMCYARVKIPSMPEARAFTFHIDIDLEDLHSTQFEVLFANLAVYEAPRDSEEGSLGESLCESMALLRSASGHNRFSRIGIVHGSIKASWYEHGRWECLYII